ncbi:uncharacterized protein LAESUDRAFT_816785 [Laetiporus sulphureus 93-53]|uniref:F-box domain-containing protein n=1 Tax=Laetiporus sulphureus 93-53 TaxID=1314785 RepID=A0A165AZP3_9APHY|nr:uncharacterized protein LAESUDRAFT_816785 [Laetiporus sulphureus 93-53]KZS99954.1 hypothetical protein LAESUDRAFT_816785 [Laetiporus sulphureus 93-53]
MDFLSLNLDVVYSVLGYIQPIDALQLAMTCRAAHDIAIPRFLSHVVLGHEWCRVRPAQIAQFCSYVLADGKVRIPCIKALTLHNTAFMTGSGQACLRVEYDYSAAVLLAQVLQRASRLARIDVYRAEHLLQSAPELANALLVLPSLEDLRLRGVGPHALRVLSMMQSGPQNLELEFARSVNDKTSTNHRQAEFLHSFTSSVLSLSLTRPFHFMEELKSDVVWPKVRRLEVRGDIYRLSTLVQTFPNVRTLYIGGALLEDSATTPAKWPALDFVSISSPAPLCCAVRRLELRYDLEILALPLFDIWSSGTMALLRQTSPAVLTCYTNMRMLKWIANNVSSLRFMQIFAHEPIYPSGANAEDIESWIGTIVSLLAALPLVGITVARSTTDAGREHAVQKLAAIVAAEIKTLQYVGLNLTTSYHSWANYHFVWFKVVSRSGDTPHLKRLTDWHGDTVERQLLATPREII